MPVTIDTDAGEQFVDSTSEDGDTVLIEESSEYDRFGWTILRS